MRYIIVFIVLFLIPAIAIAGVDIVGKIGKQNSFSGRMSITGGIGSGTPSPTGDILLVDGSSFLLQVDNSSLVCRAGGC